KVCDQISIPWPLQRDDFSEVLAVLLASRTAYALSTLKRRIAHHRVEARRSLRVEEDLGKRERPMETAALRCHRRSASVQQVGGVVTGVGNALLELVPGVLLVFVGRAQVVVHHALKRVVQRAFALARG